MIEKTVLLKKEQPLRYFTNENTGKPKLLLLHGVNLRAEYFDELFPFLQDDFEIFVPDLRGHGKSFRSSSAYNLETYTADIQTFHEKIIQEPCYGLGMSLGGRIGLSVSIKHPKILKKLIMIDVSPDINPQGLDRIISGQKSLPAFFPSFSQLQEYYEKAYAAVSKKYRESILKYSWVRNSKGHWETSYDRNIWVITPESMLHEQKFLNTGALQVRIPILVIRGEKSDILKKEDALNFITKLHQGALAEIPEASHQVLLEQTSQCVSLIKDFIRR